LIFGLEVTVMKKFLLPYLAAFIVKILNKLVSVIFKKIEFFCPPSPQRRKRRRTTTTTVTEL